jgi:hypothetical protein
LYKQYSACKILSFSYPFSHSAPFYESYSLANLKVINVDRMRLAV